MGGICEKIVQGVQCGEPCSPSETLCRKHKKQEKDNFSLRLFKEDVKDKTNSEQFLSLKEEVAMTRVLIEKIWNQCSSEAELIASSQTLSKLLEQAEKLVTASHKMDVVNGTVISEANFQKLMEKVFDIVTEEVDDAEALERISTKIINLALSFKKKND